MITKFHRKLFGFFKFLDIFFRNIYVVGNDHTQAATIAFSMNLVSLQLYPPVIVRTVVALAAAVNSDVLFSFGTLLVTELPIDIRDQNDFWY